MAIYNLRSALDDYRITKFTSDLDVESSYIIGTNPPHECECPAGVRPSCRHRQMLPHLLPLVDTEFFWDFERRLCVDASGFPSGFTVVPNAEPALTGLQEEQILMGFHNEPAKVEAISHSAACGRPAFGTTLPPGVRLPNQKGKWRRI